ncbi:hypothetical protein SNE40_009566 [Patella caerulea]|uniref:ABC transmembrane type-1 domain-containing protein n=1 Tax=Patella caerulea TaxID=87958 RepID=A0AAN8JTR0_PATCE
MLRAGDRTEIGENGVTLSGGQKARIALARAVYQDKEVYLLDDPLSAVDQHVANHLYHKCIMGLLKDKTRILCTHHVQYLKDAHIVIQMEDGKIIKSGQPSDVLPYIRDDLEEEVINEDVSNDDVNEEDGGLVIEEEQEKGVVKLRVYKSYWKAIGSCLVPVILIALFLMQASRNINDWWLSYWVSHTHSCSNTNNTTYSNSSHKVYDSYMLLETIGSNIRNISESKDNINFYLMIYGCLAGANSIFTLARAFLFAFGGIQAAQVLHKKLLASILNAPVTFFDTTPLGRIVNRFSSDVYSIDDSLPFILNIFLAQGFGIFGTIIITCYGLPWLALLLIPLGLLYYKIQVSLF